LEKQNDSSTKNGEKPAKARSFVQAKTQPAPTRRYKKAYANTTLPQTALSPFGEESPDNIEHRTA
jgi:hypothetical protein